MNFFYATKNLLSLQYKLGPDFDVMSKYTDCFGMIYRFIKIRHNVEIPREIDGKEAIEWYQELDWDKIELVNLFIRYLETNFLSVPNGFRIPGDILVLDEESEDITIAIFCGNKQALICTPEKGVTSVSMQAYTLSRVFRWAEK